ncbi:hypothetical protein UFOVP222_2 [uncultured Caudovirales phage]|uniref:Uncharacterized protein n=1 Tax=uncultured Caudovirales phage TaxID=2100421 RepID=A0A6J5TC82_9CAUD|nr:hypothetical protein UFOVP108_122 [uncultured Caudovirales phage]CAB5218877.1 hypothetical protein UFOVP222_2 [uncultured Caudovirales phage]
MARALSVKVPTASVIAMIENKIEDIEKRIASYPADVKKHKQEYADYKTQLLALAVKVIKSNATKEDGLDVGTNYNGSVQVTIDRSLITLPDEPVKPSDPNQREWIGRDHISRLELLRKNLAILKMTQQEEVNASTYSSVIDLL